MNEPIQRGVRGTFGDLPMVFCIFLLALSIFGWGLHSKLSLYSNVTEAQASTPIAKLLSEQERPSDHQTETAQPEPVQLHVVALYAAALTLPRPVEQVRPRSTVATVKPIAFSFDGPSSLRPPPYSIA